MWKRALLWLWLVGILLPMAWFTRFSPLYRRVFSRLFGPLWLHVLMHAMLFGVLAYLVTTTLRPRLQGWRRSQMVALVVGLALAVALFQEAIQLSYKARPAGPDELRDVGVDLGGAVVGMALAWRRLNWRQVS